MLERKQKLRKKKECIKLRKCVLRTTKPKAKMKMKCMPKSIIKLQFTVTQYKLTSMDLYSHT